MAKSMYHNYIVHAITREQAQECSGLLAEGKTMQEVAYDTEIPITSLRRYMRVLHDYGDIAFIPETERLQIQRKFYDKH